MPRTSGNRSLAISSLLLKLIGKDMECFKGYVRDVKPDGQVEVKAGFSINDIELDPTRKVN